MAIKRCTSVQHFTCASTDTKPTAGVPNGSLLYETDTGATYVCAGSAWTVIGPAVDDDELALAIIPEEHYQVHEGRSFTATHTVSVGSGTAVSVLVTTPSTGTCYVHFTYEIDANNAVAGTFSEAPNMSGGTAITAYNRDRSSATASNLTIKHTCSSNQSAGTVLKNHAISGANAGTLLTGYYGGREEWVLGSEKDYAFRFSAVNASTTVDINMSWYET
jgi:hypothetical protein